MKSVQVVEKIYGERVPWRKIQRGYVDWEVLNFNFDCHLFNVVVDFGLFM